MPGRGSGRGRQTAAWGGAGRGQTAALGGGAGRGHAAPAWGGAGRKPAQKPPAAAAEPTPAETERRFAEACAQIRAVSERHVSQYQLSDSEEEAEDVDDDTREQILGQCSHDVV